MRNQYEHKIDRQHKELIELRKTLAVQERLVAALTKEKGDLQEEVAFMEMEAQEQVMEAMRQAKICAGKTILEARIKMAGEAEDNGFDRSEWDVVKWKRTLTDFGEKEVAEAKGDEAVPSGIKEDEARDVNEEVEGVGDPAAKGE